MDEMLEMIAEALETSEITELENMYREAYEAALKDGATDMAEFYKGKLEALENGAETAEGSDIQGMYRDAYDAAVKNGATDMAEFYKKKLGIGDNELSFGSRNIEMSPDDARRYRELEREYEKASDVVGRHARNGDSELTVARNNQKIMDSARREMDALERKYH